MSTAPVGCADRSWRPSHGSPTHRFQEKPTSAHSDGDLRSSFDHPGPAGAAAVRGHRPSRTGTSVGAVVRCCPNGGRGSHQVATTSAPVRAPLQHAAQQIRAFQGGQGRDRTADLPLFRHRPAVFWRFSSYGIPVNTGLCAVGCSGARPRTETKTETTILMIIGDSYMSLRPHLLPIVPVGCGRLVAVTGAFVASAERC